MEYENRQPTEGINVTHENPVKKLLVYTVATVILLMTVFFVFSFLGGWAARSISFSTEVKIMESVGGDVEKMMGVDSSGPDFLERKAALNDLAVRVMANMDIPDSMHITVHYVDDDVFNAFATLGGHVFFYRGLIEQMPHENALAMVMAHEIAHEIHRDPISGLGGGLTAKIILSAAFGTSGIAGDLSAITSAVGGANFTRRMETRADHTAITAVNRLYGHVAGADALFKLLDKKAGDGDEPGWAEAFLRTHPLNRKRVQAIHETAKENGWETTGDTIELPEALKFEPVAAD